MGLLDFVFPKYCVNCRKVGAYICANCFSFISFDLSMICLACNKGSFDGLTHPRCRGRYVIDGAFSAISYKGIVKKLIYNFKYKPYLSDLNKTLVELFYESIIQQELFIKTIQQSSNLPAGRQGKTIFLVPIPLHANRLRNRGYNHSELLAKGLSNKLNLRTMNALKRTKNTKSQFGLNLKDRKENLKEAFMLDTSPDTQDELAKSLRAGKIHNANILLIDDILTTGSTLLEAARILKRNGAKKVWGLTLARD